MLSDELLKIYDEVKDRDAITIFNLINSFGIDYNSASNIYNSLIDNGICIERFFVECPECSTDVRDGLSKDIKHLINTSVKCEECYFEFEVNDKHISKLLYQAQSKKKVS